MILVLTTSSGVVMAAAVPPATAPQTAPCHGSRVEPCNLFHELYIAITKIVSMINSRSGNEHLLQEHYVKICIAKCGANTASTMYIVSTKGRDLP